ncbi:MAG: sulfite exporter TauE/SafE family protein [Gammaproteobacteria bacterium]|nr:MAG: sulfite exporter TauE/SafE family protein [Gammaproteobacteria bacterium]RKZ96744.1 MAG: sulfite exporter TauE/SafE family protein [Gammaproteobacteria bacterium]RLA02140.1 MAG: sulfite exporter TauE/SafE family protein [Gammaproteobacteria bacterium]
MEAITSSYITAFLLGLFSTVHCIAMCGSVIGALTLSLPAEVRESQRKMLPYVFNYNLGRLLSYGIAGVIVGLLSAPLTAFNGHLVLRYFSVIVMIAMGLYLAGWFPKFAHMERLGAPIWKWLQPVGQKLLPVRKRSQAFLLGMVWGWLPCGLVYAALAVAATVGEPVKASLVMLAFGAGTLPAVMGAGMFTGLLASMARAKHLRQIAGVLIIAMALATALWPMDHNSDHSNHVQHSEHVNHTMQGR